MKKVSLNYQATQSRRAVSFSVPRISMITEVRSLSAGAPSNAMNPLSFEEVDLRNTPLSSLRSCSEFQQNHNVPKLSRMSETINSKSALKSVFSFLMRKDKSSANGLKKSNLDGADDAEKNFFVHSMTRRDEVEVDKNVLTVVNNQPETDSFCMPRHAKTNSSVTRKSQSSSSHRHSIEESSREENQINNQHHRRHRQSSSDRDTSSFMHESSAATAIDILFGINSYVHKLPMEIELKTIRSTTIEVRSEYFDDLTLDSSSLQPLSLILPHERNDRQERYERYERHDRRDFPNSPRFALMLPLDRASGGSENNTMTHSLHAGNSSPVPLRGVSYAFSVTDISSWYPCLQSSLAVALTSCRTFVSTGSAADEALYDQLRIQPFSFGAYLRGMLWAGFCGLFFTAYSLFLWPTFNQSTSTMDSLVSTLVYGYLLIQFTFNVIQLPNRIYLHVTCWESSRDVNVEESLTLLRNMIHSDSWVLNRFIGRIQDVLSMVFLGLGECYLHNSDPAGNLNSVIVSICAPTLLAFVMRVTIATLFSLSCHDPQVLGEARRRGLSKLDLDVLATFVFSRPEEVNNVDCSICLCDFDMGEMLISLPCDKKHSFHAGCIRQWLQRQNSCPLCQKMV